MEFLLPAERASLHVSVSQVRAYQLCPRKYQLRYVLGAVAEQRSANLLLGTAVHEALAEYYRIIAAGELAEREVLFGVLQRKLADSVQSGPPVVFDDGEDMDQLVQQGRNLLQAFLEQGTMPEKVVGVEQQFVRDIIDPDSGELLEEQLVGYLDAVIEEGGRRLAVEHKTAAKAWSQDQLDHDLQVSLYQAMTGAEAVRLQVLTKTKVPRLLVHELQRDERQQVEAVRTVCRVLDAVRAGAFWPNRGWACRSCEYQRRCGG